MLQPLMPRSWGWTVLWWPTRPSRTNTKKNVLFIIGNWNTKVVGQEILGVTGKFGLGVQNEVGQRLKEFCQENILIIANTLFQEHERWLYTWTLPNDQYWNQVVYIISCWGWRSCIQLEKTRPEAEYGLGHQTLIAKSRLKLKKVGENH